MGDPDARLIPAMALKKSGKSGDGNHKKNVPCHDGNHQNKNQRRKPYKSFPATTETNDGNHKKKINDGNHKKRLMMSTTETKKKESKKDVLTVFKTHSVCMYIYIYRERERYTHIYTYIHNMCIYIHIHTYITTLCAMMCYDMPVHDMLRCAMT